MTCPDKIKLVGFIVPLLLAEDREDVWGEWDGRENTITLNAQASKDHLKDSLLHDAIHGIDEFLGLNLKHSVVYALSQHIWLMFKENPELAQWFFEDDD